MAEPKGPKVELPEDLEEGIEGDSPEPGSEPDLSDEESSVEAAKASDASDAPDLGAALEEAKDRHLRLLAEFENFKRRSLREHQELRLYASEAVVKELLPTVDNLERALEHARTGEEGGDIEKLLEGIELTHRSLLQVLERVGVEVVEALGKTFDPEVHEAIRRAASDEHPTNTVTEEFQRGYKLHDRLLRPALVAVSSGKGSS